MPALLTPTLRSGFPKPPPDWTAHWDPQTQLLGSRWKRGRTVNQPGGDARAESGLWASAQRDGHGVLPTQGLTQAPCPFLLGLRYVGLIGYWLMDRLSAHMNGLSLQADSCPVTQGPEAAGLVFLVGQAPP